MPSHFAKVLVCLGLALLSLTLLSALVEGPQDAAVGEQAARETPVQSADEEPVQDAVLWPQALGMPDGAGPNIAVSLACRGRALPMESPCLAIPAPAPARDANGRVVAAASYVRSVYVIFDPMGTFG